MSGKQKGERAEGLSTCEAYGILCGEATFYMVVWVAGVVLVLISSLAVASAGKDAASTVRLPYMDLVSRLLPASGIVVASRPFFGCIQCWSLRNRIRLEGEVCKKKDAKPGEIAERSRYWDAQLAAARSLTGKPDKEKE